MILLTTFFALGVWLLQQQPSLPDLRWAALILLLLPALRMPILSIWHRITRATLLLMLALICGYFYAAWMAQQRLGDALPALWQGRDIVLTGRVAEMPRVHERGLSFVFDVEQINTPGAQVPRHLLLSTYIGRHDEALDLHAGERWQLTVRLKQPHGSSNPYNFDFEAWALERNLRATGYVYGKGDNHRLDAQFMLSNLFNTPGYFLEGLREAVRTHFQRILGDAPYVGVLSALAIGDQSSIPAAQWQVFTRTGVNHLMSI